MVSDQPIEAREYTKRPAAACWQTAGVGDCDGFSLPLPTTFAQNNGVIQDDLRWLRHVGKYIAVILVLPGSFLPVDARLRRFRSPVLAARWF